MKLPKPTVPVVTLAVALAILALLGIPPLARRSNPPVAPSPAVHVLRFQVVGDTAGSTAQYTDANGTEYGADVNADILTVGLVQAVFSVADPNGCAIVIDGQTAATAGGMPIAQCVWLSPTAPKVRH